MNLQGHRNDASESRPGYLLLCHWSVWIVQECGFHVKPLFGFLFLWDCSGFLQIRSRMYIEQNTKVIDIIY